MALSSRSGAWRLYSSYYAMKNGYPISSTKWGKFRCADFASTIQFSPGWEPLIKEQVENCRGLFVDVGANIGFYSVMAAKKGNEVIAFEPNPKAFECLLENLRFNNVWDKVTPFKAAAWSENGSVILLPGRHTDTSKVLATAGETSAYKLDTILNQRWPKLIKIDTEGVEAEVIRGAYKILSEARPKVIFEAWDKRRAERVISFFPDGYSFKQLDRTNYLASRY